MLRRGYVDLYAVGCSAKEIAQLEGLSTDALLKLRDLFRRLVGNDRCMPLLRAICYGEEAKPGLAPREVREHMGKGYGGFWIRNLDVIICTFTPVMPVWEVLGHELAHALLDRFSNGFPYPYALTEGFARAIGHTWASRFFERSGGDASRTVPRGKLPLVSESFHMSIEQLLFFEKGDDPLDDVELASRVSWMSLLLNGFIWRLGSERPSMRRILAELRAAGLWGPADVYAWMQTISGLSGETLERQFHEYCAAGVVPTSLDEGSCAGEKEV